MNAALKLRPIEPSRRIDLIFIDAGGGHRAAAIALKAVLERWRPSWRIRMVNLRDVLDPVDVLRRFTRVRAENLYNYLLKHDLGIAMGTLLPALHLLVRRMHRREVSALAAFWRMPRPDLVVSLVPHFNRAIFEGLREAGGPRWQQVSSMVTILTDLADYPPNFWIERQDQYVICGTARAAEQALAMGHSPDRVLRASGMIVRPEFYEPFTKCREAEQRRLGLVPGLPTGVVLFGGFGSRQMLTIARQVAEARVKTQLIFLCGHNQRLRERLLAMRLPFPHHVESGAISQQRTRHGACWNISRLMHPREQSCCWPLASRL